MQQISRTRLTGLTLASPVPNCRGGVLFEVLLALALFAGASAFALGAMQSMFTALDRLQREQEAVDLARTKLSQLEAGLITLADLRDGATVASERGGDDASRWRFELRTRRTAFTGLTLVELTVRETAEDRDDFSAASFTLRQLVKLRQEQQDDADSDSLSALQTELDP